MAWYEPMPENPPPEIDAAPSSGGPTALRIAALTSRQRECLRLVGQGFELKDIGRALGISDMTVKQHLRAARDTLGVSRSLEAARMLASVEMSTTSAWGASPPRAISKHRGDEAQDASQSEGRGGSRGLRDAAWSTDQFVSPDRPALPLPFPTRSGQRNGLGLIARFASAMVLLVLLIASIGFFVEASIGLSGH